jgi:hypothetical protein
MPGAFHAVDSVPMQAAYLAADGTARTTYVVVWVGHGLEEASYEPRESFTGQQPAQRQLMATDILPLEARLEQEGRQELKEHHRQTLARVQHELRRVVKRCEGSQK